MPTILKKAAVALLLLGLMAYGALAEDAVQTDSCRTALITINLDIMTVGFAGTGDPFPAEWRTADDRHIVAANAELIPAARQAGLLIIYLYGNYSYLEEGEELATFDESIAPQEGDLLIARPELSTDVFGRTILLEELQTRGIQSLILGGLNTGYCINRSAQKAARLGFDVTVVANAHSGGQSKHAQTYNDYWPTVGLAVVPFAELDFEALCAHPESPEDAEGGEG